METLTKTNKSKYTKQNEKNELSNLAMFEYIFTGQIMTLPDV